MYGKRIRVLIISMAVLLMACAQVDALHRIFGPANESPVSIAETEVAYQPNPLGDNPTEAVLAPGGQPTALAASPTLADTAVALTPEEQANAGRHFYAMTGTFVPVLGNNGVIDWEKLVNFEFKDGGVYFGFEDNLPLFFTRVGPNEYTHETEDTFTKLIFLENGFEASRELVHQLWRPALESGAGESKHPKSALQEWAAGNRRKPPEYEVVDRSGPDHAAKFTVRVSVHKVGEATATAGSKGEAEKAAAKKFMEKYG